jgi:trimethylamine--corrinoid protein Co-methyltransferase
MADQTLTKLHEATLRLLERTGVHIGSAQALDLLEAGGVRLDRSSGRVYPTAGDIERALGTAPRAFRVYGRRTGSPLEFDGAHTYFLSGGASLRVLELDGLYTPAGLEHLHQFNRLLDALPHIHMLINQVDPKEFHGLDLYRLVAAEMLIGTPKPICFQAATVQDVQVMLEMGTVIRGSREALVARPVYFVGLNSEPPLSVSAHIAEALLHCCRSGIPCSLGNYNMMGITAPRTVAGAVVQLNALQLAAIVLSQACKPGAPIFYTAFSGSGNMQTLDPVCADPLSVQQQRLTAQMGRFYGLPVYGFAGTDSRLPDAQAACEHAFQFQAAMEAGVNLLQGPTSMMDQMMMSSFAQAVIDHDIIAYLLACRREAPLDEEALALGVIQEVVSEPQLQQLKFAGHEHTVRHLQEGRWEPLCFSYENFAAWQKGGRRTLVELATEAARRLLDEHRPEPLPPEQEAAIRALASPSGGR